MTYKKCFFCTKRYYHSTGKLQTICNKCIGNGFIDITKPVLNSKCKSCDNTFNYQNSKPRTICNICINLGFKESNDPIVSKSCAICSTNYKYQKSNNTATSTRCKKCIHVKKVKCVYCDTTTNSYTKNTCSKCDDINDYLKNYDTLDESIKHKIFKDNYMLVFYNDRHVYKDIDCDSYGSVTIQSSELDYDKTIMPLLRDYDLGTIDEFGYINIEKIPRYYFPLAVVNVFTAYKEYNNNSYSSIKKIANSQLVAHYTNGIAKARIVKKSELFDQSEYDKDEYIDPNESE